MAKKKDNLKSVKTDELEKKIEAIHEDIRVIRFKGQGAKSKNVKEVAAKKKDIARILTEVNYRLTKDNK